MPRIVLRAMLAMAFAFLALGAVTANAQTAPDCQYQPPSSLQILFPGIGYQTLGVACANGQHQTLAHVLIVDVGSGAISLGASTATHQIFPLRLPSEYLVAKGAAVAVNANLFGANCCYYAPSAETLTTELCGWQVSAGKMQSPPAARAPHCQTDYPFNASLVQMKNGAVKILYSDPAPTVVPDAATAVTGSHMLVFLGQNVAPITGASPDFFGPNARTLAGLSQDGKTLWLVALDKTVTGLTGLQLDEAAAVMIHLKAVAAINLDGGGSSSMVKASGGAFAFLNSPSDLSSGCAVYFPNAQNPVSCERYVGASLGVFVGGLGRKAERK